MIPTMGTWANPMMVAGDSLSTTLSSLPDFFKAVSQGAFRVSLDPRQASHLAA